MQILHADLTIYRPLDNTKVYIYFLADNFSRKILAWKASLEYSAKYTFENLNEVYDDHNLFDVKPENDYMVDDGSENKAVVEYNNKPYQPILGLTPNEVFAGKIPDKNMFKKEIKEEESRKILQIHVNLINKQ